MARSRRSNSNLFAFDYEVIRTTLTDANEQLLTRRASLLDEFSKAPEMIMSQDDIHGAQKLAKQLGAAIKDARSARLSDGRPFQDAIQTVKEFFGETEKPLKDALQELRHRLTSAAHKAQTTSPASPVSEPTNMGTNVSGETIATATPHPPEEEITSQVEISLDWEIEGFERSLLDFESLRPYLTDNAIIVACRKHLADHGPNKLVGVQYHQVARS